MSDKPSLKSCVGEWLKTINNNEHFYLKDDPFGCHINCKCPISLDGMGKLNEDFSGVSFVWIQDNRIFTRPKSFWIGGVPYRHINIHDPNCFKDLESILETLHTFFRNERFFKKVT